MIDMVQVALAIIALFSAVFVGVTEGFKLTLGFSGSEETRNRKNRIDDKLQKQVDDEITDFLASDSVRDGSPDRTNGFEDLGYKCLVAYNVTNDIISKSNSMVKFGFITLIYAFAFLSLALIIGFYADLSNLAFILALGISAAVMIYYVLQSMVNFKKGLSLREEFIKLDDTPTLECAMKVNEEKL